MCIRYPWTTQMYLTLPVFVVIIVVLSSVGTYEASELGLLRLLVSFALELVVKCQPNQVTMAASEGFRFLLEKVLPQTGDIVIQLDVMEMMCASSTCLAAVTQLDLNL